ncbi:hypothetical protein PHMEG_00025186 [Phytophthora megakarya]|uniref:MULE transposase domain-containing protein n=1 Tax=Phytophthora megakarya TaxID=4795 RepID=A0A225VE28_9STRA|nr:hypothetical protein PHMEG_00025186 [Phytophthora megakarya]
MTGKALLVSTVMGDAEDAQFNAFERVFGDDNKYIYLMWFYHLVAKVVEKRKECQKRQKIVYFEAYTMFTLVEYIEFVRVNVVAWRDSPETKEFAEYFVNQWLQGKFVRWQCFHTVGGFASTNNPAEQFNKKLKRDYTLRQRLTMGTLLQQLLSCCHNESSSMKGFRVQVEPSSLLQRRTKDLASLAFSTKLPYS